MTVSRAQLVNVSVTRWYHVVSRTVRGARLLAEDQEDRRAWLERRLHELSQLFAIELAAFAVLDNAVQMLVHLSPELAERWSGEELIRRWTALHPPRGSNQQLLEITQAWIDQQAADVKALAQCRQRLTDLAWFMKCLREPIARRANRQDDCRGSFWQSRYQSIAILDDKALLASCVAIDLSPMAAGLAASPKQSPFTSLPLRLRQASGKTGAPKRRTEAVDAARRGADCWPENWLCPLDASHAGSSHCSSLLEGLTLDGYVQLVTWTARAVLHGQSGSSRPAESVLKLLDISPEIWQATMQKLFSRSKHLGVAFAFSRQRLKEAAQHRGCHHLANINGCPATPEEPSTPCR